MALFKRRLLIAAPMISISIFILVVIEGCRGRHFYKMQKQSTNKNLSLSFSLPTASTNTRVPNRGFKFTPSLPYLVINVSWSLSPSNPCALIHCLRAEVDTAIVMDSLSYGPGCPHTYSSERVKFTGDDAYSTGWEAYQVVLQPTYNTNVNANTSEEENSIDIFAVGHRLFKTNVTITANLFNASNVLISTKRLLIGDFEIISGFCATSSGAEKRIANLRAPHLTEVMLSPGTSVADMNDDKNYLDSPTPTLEEPKIASSAEEELLSPTVQQTMSLEEPSSVLALSWPVILPEWIPGMDNSTVLLVSVSWVGGSTDIESGIHISGFPRMISICDVMKETFIVSSGNSYAVKGNEWFMINLEKLRESESWRSSNLFVDVYADWWQLFHKDGNVTVTASIQKSNGEVVGKPFIVGNINPSATFNCMPNTIVATLAVKYDRAGLYHLRAGQRVHMNTPIPHSSPVDESETKLYFGSPDEIGLAEKSYAPMMDLSTDAIMAQSVDPIDEETVYSSETPHEKATGMQYFNGPQPSAMSAEKADPDTGMSEEPTLSMMLDPSVDPSMYPTFEASGSPEPEDLGESTPDVLTPFPEVKPSLEVAPTVWKTDVTEPLGEARLVVTFSWPITERDLDSQIRFIDQYAGYGCHAKSAKSNMVLFEGDVMTFGGEERFFVRLGRAWDEVMWNNMVDIDLGAHWFEREAYTDEMANVKVDLKDEHDVTVNSIEAMFNPFNRNPLSPHYPLGHSCLKNKIGKVTVQSNGSLYMHLGLY